MCLIRIIRLCNVRWLIRSGNSMPYGHAADKGRSAPEHVNKKTGLAELGWDIASQDLNSIGKRVSLKLGFIELNQGVSNTIFGKD